MSTPSPSAPAPDTTVEQSTEIDADVDEVWEVLTDPDALGRWLGREVDLDLQPGAAGRVVDPDGTVRQVLVTDVEEAARVAWHWWEDDGPLTSVEITLTPTPSGTRVDVQEIYAVAPRAVIGGRPDGRGLRGSAAAPLHLTGVEAASFALAPARWSLRLAALAATRFAPAAR
jgi:uncharacterized protein YndB with AHSA1/START domain